MFVFRPECKCFYGYIVLTAIIYEPLILISILSEFLFFLFSSTFIFITTGITTSTIKNASTNTTATTTITITTAATTTSTTNLGYRLLLQPLV